jgi:tetratricopeptide (TPR) repeat protein
MCRIQFKNRQFTMAIHTGKMAIDINRHYDGVYEYIALAYKAKGRWKEAIATMECALRYEIPWDKRNHQRLKALYDELTQEASLIEK